MDTLADDIWVHEDTMALAGTQLRLRMTIIKLADGSLWLHSPTQLSPQLKADIEQLGPVSCIVGASNGHNLWLQQWQQAFPEARLYVSAGIVKKLQLSQYQLLDESFDNIWQQDVDIEHMQGVPFFNESVFLHKKTRSLIVTDFIQNHSDERATGRAGLISRFILEPLGFKGICVAPPLKMGFMIKDKPAFAASIQALQEWDFERIIVTHGDIIEQDAKLLLNNLCQRFLH
jgi:Domain of unknown function (DUF4336)